MAAAAPSSRSSTPSASLFHLRVGPTRWSTPRPTAIHTQVFFPTLYAVRRVLYESNKNPRSSDASTKARSRATQVYGRHQHRTVRWWKCAALAASTRYRTAASRSMHHARPETARPTDIAPLIAYVDIETVSDALEFPDATKPRTRCSKSASTPARGWPPAHGEGSLRDARALRSLDDTPCFGFRASSRLRAFRSCA